MNLTISFACVRKGKKMNDLVKKDAVINTIDRLYKMCDTESISDYHDLMVAAVLDLPPSEPERRCEVSDLIDRNFALSTYQDLCDGIACDECKMHYDDYYGCRLEEWIEKLPSAEPERKTGHWTEERLLDIHGGSFVAYRCSECSEVFNWQMGYCGSCGAKMEVEND